MAWGEELLACGELALTAGSVLLARVPAGTDQVIFSSFLCSHLLILLICLSLTLRCLNSLTLSINSWHLFMVDVDKVDTNFDLHNALCLALYAKHGLARNIKESIFIRVNNPTLNRNIGNFNLPHIWDRVLLNTPGLTLKGMCKVLGIQIPTPPI